MGGDRSSGASDAIPGLPRQHQSAGLRPAPAISARLRCLTSRIPLSLGIRSQQEHAVCHGTLKTDGDFREKENTRHPVRRWAYRRFDRAIDAGKTGHRDLRGD